MLHVVGGFMQLKFTGINVKPLIDNSRTARSKWLVCGKIISIVDVYTNIINLLEIYLFNTFTAIDKLKMKSAYVYMQTA